MTNIIFDDLEIDHSDKLTDPAAFCKRVYAKAEELRTILRTNTSVSDYIAKLPKETADFTEFAVHEDAIYELAQTMPLVSLPDLVKRIQKLARDVENLIDYRATQDLANNHGHLDKQTTHEQYNRLREIFNQYVHAMKVLGKFEAQPLPNMPGNYGKPVGLPRYVFLLDGETEWMRNPVAVAKKLGITQTNLMDVVDYVKSNPNCGCKVEELSK